MTKEQAAAKEQALGTANEIFFPQKQNQNKHRRKQNKINTTSLKKTEGEKYAPIPLSFPFCTSKVEEIDVCKCHIETSRCMLMDT